MVRRSVEAGNAGKIDSEMSALAADAEWRVADEHPESRVCRGREEIRGWQVSGLALALALNLTPVGLQDLTPSPPANGR